MNHKKEKLKPLIAEDVRDFMDDNSVLLFKWVEVDFDKYENFLSETNNSDLDTYPKELSSDYVQDLDKKHHKKLKKIIGENIFNELISGKLDTVFVDI